MAIDPASDRKGELRRGETPGDDGPHRGDAGLPDPQALAAFYQQATGLPLAAGSEEDFAGLWRDGGLFLGFQRVADYQPPSWPEQSAPQQSHLDFVVDDLDLAEEALLRKAPPSPGSSRAVTGGESFSTRPGTRSASPRRGSSSPLRVSRCGSRA